MVDIKKYIYKLRNSNNRDAFIKDILIAVSKDVEFDTKDYLFCLYFDG
jgi:hypothetical protein